MIESPATSIPARTAPAVDHRDVGNLDYLISRIAAGDRAAFRLLYAFMAMRVWHTVTETPLGLADAVAVTQSTFVEVWHLAGAAASHDADRLHAIDAIDAIGAIGANGGRGACAGQPHPAADNEGRPPADAEYDAHIHHELTALPGGGRATFASALASSPGSTTSPTHSPPSPPRRKQPQREQPGDRPPHHLAIHTTR